MQLMYRGCLDCQGGHGEGGEALGHPDAVVIGAGAVGLSCACALRETQLEVLVLERERPGAGASWANAGWVVPSHSVPLAEPGVVRRGLRWLVHPESPVYVPMRPDPAVWGWLWRFWRSATGAHVRRALPLLARLQRRSLQLYEQLACRGLEFGFCKAGSLSVFLDPEELTRFAAEVDVLRREGIRAEVMDRAAVLEKEPLLRPQVAGGVYFPEDAHLDPSRLVQALVEHAQRLGVEVRAPAGVLTLRREGQAVAVELRGQKLRPRWVVMAAGVWSAGLLRGAGVHLPILPAKGYSVTLPVEPTPASPVMLTEARVAVTPLRGPGDARLRLAGTLELGVWAETLNLRRVEAIRRAASRYLKVETEGGQVWAGLRPCTPDGLPAVGRPREVRNLLVATGHGTLGISLAPATGELVAHLVSGKEPGEDLKLLSPDRFR